MFITDLRYKVIYSVIILIRTTIRTAKNYKIRSRFHKAVFGPPCIPGTNSDNNVI